MRLLFENLPKKQNQCSAFHLGGIGKVSKWIHWLWAWWWLEVQERCSLGIIYFRTLLLILQMTVWKCVQLLIMFYYILSCLFCLFPFSEFCSKTEVRLTNLSSSNHPLLLPTPAVQMWCCLLSDTTHCIAGIIWNPSYHFWEFILFSENQKKILKLYKFFSV